MLLRVYAVGSAALALSLVWAVADHYRADWREHQAEYAGLVAAAGGPGAPSVSVGLRQQFLPELGAIDRCMTCHVGIDDPHMVGRAQPHGAHPGDHLETHPPERFGCTACHGGDGRAVTFEGASHEPGPESVQPMVSRQTLEARCGTCHTGAEVAGAPALSAGRRHLTERGCLACHEVPGVRLVAPFGSGLDAVGSKLARGTIEAWIRDPKAARPEALMPRFRLSDAQVGDLAAMLSTRRAELRQVDPLEDGDSDVGRSLFGQSRCTTCHSVRGKGGTVGPALDRVGERVSPAWLVAWLRDPHQLDPDTVMPQVGYTEQETLDLAAYLLEEMVADDFEATAVEEAAVSAEQVASGVKLFDELNCAACHVLKGIDRTRQFAPSLVGFGSKPMEHLSFALMPEGTNRTLADWTFRKVGAPESQMADAKMPSFTLGEREQAELTLALLSLRKVPWGPSTVIPVAEEPPFRPAGAVGALVARYRCLSCHTVGATGANISRAPLDREGSKVNGPWLRAFLLNPDTLRVGQEERMPHLRMKEAEAETLSAFVSLVLVDDRIPTLAPGPVSPDEEPRGRVLFEEHGCRACHIQGGKGGYVGPDLYRTGERLRSGWVYTLLRTPKVAMPEAPHPDYALSHEDARSLVAFLLTQRASDGGGALVASPPEPAVPETALPPGDTEREANP